MTEQDAILKVLGNRKSHKCSALIFRVEKLTGRLDMVAFDAAVKALLASGQIKTANVYGDVELA